MDKLMIETKLKELVVKYSTMTIAPEDINADSDLINDFGFDSVSIIRFVVELEREFRIAFEDEDLAVDFISKYNNLLSYIVERAG